KRQPNTNSAPGSNNSNQPKSKNEMKRIFQMTNFRTGESVRKIQKTMPRMKGFICVSIDRVLPQRNSRGERLFFDANNRPYYAAENEEGFHYQP
ncbi:hypothetical protein RZS08_16150, partial [Arthrospira platensis SPKY1]|nr:hypothetical protein [Arthrospira platensis SPKY1]